MGFAASYAGADKFFGAIVPFGLGATPSTFTMFGYPSSVPRVGDVLLAHSEVGSQISLKNCILKEVTEVGHVPAWHFQDRRSLLDGPPCFAEYNVPVAGGASLAHERSPQSIASELFDAMGETGYSVSLLPNAPRPYFNGRGMHPADALDHLCEMLGCAPALGLNNKMFIRKLGSGEVLSDANFINGPNGTHAYNTRPTPANAVVHFDPTIFQCRFLLEAVVIDSDSNLADLDGMTFGFETPWVGFPGFAAESGFGDRRDIERSALRLYRIRDTAPDTLYVPGFGNITGISQVVLNDKKVQTQSTSGNATGFAQAEVHGKFFAGEYYGVTHSAIKRYPHKFKIHRDGMFVEFDRPVFKTGTNGVTEACTELYLETSFFLKSSTLGGELVRSSRSKLISSATDALFDEHLHQPWYETHVSSYDSSGNVSSTSSSTSAVNLLSDNLLNALADSLSPMVSYPQMMFGLQPINPDGRNRQVTWLAGLPAGDGVSSAPRTLVGINCEPYEFGISYEQRKAARKSSTKPYYSPPQPTARTAAITPEF